MGGEPVRGAEGEGRLLDIFGGESLGQRPNPRARMFTGIFEGNGRTVGNLFVDDTSRRYVGLFGYVGPGGVVRNVGLSAANADSVVRGGSYAGALAGAVEGARVSGVWSAVPVAAVAVGAHSGGHFAGGLVGSASRRSFVAEGWASGAVSGSSSVGGLVGNLQGSGAAAVWASGAVSGGYSVGGLVGYVSDSHVRAAYARSAVSASSVSPADSAGGLVGRVGDASAQPWLRAVFASGAVSAPNGAAVGGLVGGCDGTAAARGGGVGYWDTQATGVAASPGCGTGAHGAPVGTARTTADLQAPTGYEGVYAGWDVDVDVAAHAGSFDGPGDDPWHFGTSSQYPALKHCADKPGIDTADAQPYCPLQPHSQRPAAAAGHTVDPDVVAKVKNLAAQAQHGTAHVNRWTRVLAAFGEHDGSGVTGGPMTADEAQQMADAHSSPVWDQVVAELTALEAAPLQTPPPPPPLPTVSVTAAAGGIEGDPATFTLTASPAPTADLPVSVTVAATGDFGAAAGSRTVTIPTSGTATVTVATADDDTDEPDGQVTLTVNTGTGYTVGAPATETATVADDDDPAGEQTGQGYTVDPDVVAKVQNLAAQTQHGTAHVNRWNRVLAAFGEHDGSGVTGGPMTADEAQQMADAHSSPVWDEVVAELAALQTATQTTPPPPPPPPPLPAVSITGSSGGIEGDPATFTLTASPAPTAD
ncbi:MAG: hypothetical protein OXH86_10430, partial [Acidimicrobiaceae bacterium]|nr:hypothetical protein [Acidimicrobiaceae bacterium]